MHIIVNISYIYLSSVLMPKMFYCFNFIAKQPFSSRISGVIKSYFVVTIYIQPLILGNESSMMV